MVNPFPLKLAVTRVRRDEAGVDELGNDVVTEIRESIKVFGWYSTTPDEPIIAGHERVVVDVALIAKSGDFEAGDAVVLPGDDSVYEVIGGAANYDHNPWWSPGREVVGLKVVKG